MAKAVTDTIEVPSREAKTVDDLFQFLVRARDIPPPLAKKTVLEALQLDKLRVDIHTRGGARKGPMRQATEEELQAVQAGATLDHLYETVPPEGITERVHFQSWDGILGLAIKDGSLVVVPECSLGYPWHAYSFTVANWPIVYELWPAPAALKLGTPAPSPRDDGQKQAASGRSSQTPSVDPFKTGGAGRPQAAHIVRGEESRITSGKMKPKRGDLERFAQVLKNWWDDERQKYDPLGPHMSRKAIENAIRDLWNRKLSKFSNPTKL